MIGEEGVAIYNVCSRLPSMYTVFKKQFEGVFKYVYLEESQDVNRVLIERQWNKDERNGRRTI